MNFRDEELDSNMISLRVGLLQYSYSCKQMPSFVMWIFILIIIRVVLVFSN